MEKAEAQELVTRLGLEHPERAKYRWLAREQADGDWTVVKVVLPSSGPLTPMVETRPKPPYDDSKQPWESAGGLPPHAAGG
jgi:hypothetical protein